MGRTSTSQNPAFAAYCFKVSGRITVPVSAEWRSALPTGRQCSTLQPYIIHSTSLPLALNRSLTRSSIMRTDPRSPSKTQHRSQRTDRVRQVVNALEGRHEVVTSLQ
jgi:hypothetical protein